MFVFHIYSSFLKQRVIVGTKGILSTETIISFNSGKISIKKPRIAIIISPWKTCLFPSDAEM